ncbi:hypothetical protein ACJX0J_007437, partial [Zea mays]
SKTLLYLNRDNFMAGIQVEKVTLATIRKIWRCEELNPCLYHHLFFGDNNFLFPCFESKMVNVLDANWKRLVTKVLLLIVR